MKDAHVPPVFAEQLPRAPALSARTAPHPGTVTGAPKARGARSPLLLVGLNGRDSPSVERILLDHGLAPLATHSGVAALELCAASSEPPLVLADLECGIDWATLLPRLASREGVRVIGIGARPRPAGGELDGLMEAILPRPIRVADLVERIRRCQETAAGPPAPAARPLLSSRNPKMQRVLERLRLAAPSEATVLLRGETGTGKEVLARAVHGWSARRRGRFFSLNCGALQDTLLDSELFGHEKGAFTGALRCKRGLVELANGGTLFLDEVGELSPAMQVKLLRVLQQREFMRVGGEEVLRCDVRVVAATHRDLDEMVADGRLRADLYYRLQVFPVFVPPLRERREDLIQLAEHLLDRIARSSGRPAPRLGARARSTLLSHPWPGNVRELENVLERSLLLCAGGEIGELDLTGREVRAHGEPAGGLAAIKRLGQREYLLRLLAQHRGNVSAAAISARVDRKTLYRHLRALRIDPDRFRRGGAAASR